MRARLPAIVGAIALIASACAPAASPSPAASTAASVPAATSAGPAESPADSPSASASAAAGGGLLRVARISDFLPSIHPVSLGTGNQELMADIMFSTLVDVDSDEVTILPDLAESWEVGEDAKTYTFHLNPDAVWSDGEPVTVDDVIFTISWANQNPTAFKQLGVVAFLNTAGGDEVEGTTDVPSGLNKIDDHTIEITLETADSTYLRRLAGAVYYIWPEHVLEGLTAAEAETCDFCLGVAGETPGSGPFDITTSISATGAGFTAKQNYWKGKDSQITEMDYRIQESNVSVAQLAAGELDLVIRVPPAEGPGLEDVEGLEQLNVPGVGIFAINFNHNHTDKAFRQAVAYAINRPETIESVLGGLATLNHTIPPGFTLYDDINRYEFDPARAKELLGESTWDPSKPIRLALLAEDPNFTQTAPALQQYIQDNLGLTVELTSLPTAPYTELLENTDDWDMYLSFGGSEGVGWYQSQQYYSCDEGTALLLLKFSEERGECDLYDPLFEQAASVVGDEQDEILHELALLLNENLPEIYLWQPNYLHVHTDRLGGGFTIYPNERESFQKILDWTYEPE
jgi:peptide/nickel transport system substrate-binding protein